MPRVPIFPLNSVLFPGVAAPLHIFEERYRQLIHDLLAIPRPADRVFGVVAIREGYEVGSTSVQSAHRVGTLVQLTSTTPDDDGGYDVEVTGRQRFRTMTTHEDGPYLTADVDLLEDTDETDGGAAAARVLSTFERYRRELSALRGGPVLTSNLPRDPGYLSWTLASTCLLALDERQRLLEADSPAERLRMLDRLLRAEIRAIRAIPSLPATEVARTRWSPN